MVKKINHILNASQNILAHTFIFQHLNRLITASATSIQFEFNPIRNLMRGFVIFTRQICMTFLFE